MVRKKLLYQAMALLRGTDRIKREMHVPLRSWRLQSDGEYHWMANDLARKVPRDIIDDGPIRPS